MVDGRKIVSLMQNIFFMEANVLKTTWLFFFFFTTKSKISLLFNKKQRIVPFSVTFRILSRASFFKKNWNENREAS